MAGKRTIWLIMMLAVWLAGAELAYALGTPSPVDPVSADWASSVNSDEIDNINAVLCAGFNSTGLNDCQAAVGESISGSDAGMAGGSNEDNTGSLVDLGVGNGGVSSGGSGSGAGTGGSSSGGTGGSGNINTGSGGSGISIGSDLGAVGSTSNGGSNFTDISDIESSETDPISTPISNTKSEITYSGYGDVSLGKPSINSWASAGLKNTETALPIEKPHQLPQAIKRDSIKLASKPSTGQGGADIISAGEVDASIWKSVLANVFAFQSVNLNGWPISLTAPLQTGPGNNDILIYLGTLLILGQCTAFSWWIGKEVLEMVYGKNRK